MSDKKPSDFSDIFHERIGIVSSAKYELTDYINLMGEKYSLTTAETISLLSSEISSLASSCITHERDNSIKD